MVRRQITRHGAWAPRSPTELLILVMPTRRLSDTIFLLHISHRRVTIEPNGESSLRCAFCRTPPLILRWPPCCQFCISHFKRRTGASLLGLARVAESASSDHGALMCHVGRSNFGRGCPTGGNEGAAKQAKQVPRKAQPQVAASAAPTQRLTHSMPPSASKDPLAFLTAIPIQASPLALSLPCS